MTSTLERPSVNAVDAAAEATLSRLGLIWDALRHPENHRQAFRFLCVGGSGYVVNTLTLALCVHLLGLAYAPAFFLAFLTGTANNFWWNRNWTFDATHHHIGRQGIRFLLVSAIIALAAFGISELLLTATGMEKVLASAAAYVIVTPLSFVIQKLWSFKA
jgi:putative flippase GtrA